MNNDIANALDNTRKHLLSAIEVFTPAQFNRVPFENSWTPGQVAEHLLKADGGALEMIHGATAITDRQPDEKNEIVSAIFLDFNTKMKSPDFILPSSEPKDKNNMLQQLNDKLAGLAQAAREMDLTRTCTAFELPGLGLLTRLEWLNFANVHTRRHIHQLENIHKVTAGVIQ
ncbi:DinB family protein [Deminuibacter soli]|uniref:DinB family protein n=1 Tax=Deminuibacter soli TaxID=2291815 RepID=A0A3E1NCJ4_9BACT|nr:DinB family protein [Deminuibacter soli]RFM25660.1 DinB family protein [Deminuibacter soli]